MPLPQNLNQQQRAFLQKFYLNKLAPLLDEHWRRVVCWRSGSDNASLEVGEPPEGFQALPENSQKHLILTDFLFLSRNKEKKEAFYTCSIPEERVFWEAILAFYPLFLQSRYPNTESVAHEMLSIFEDETLKIRADAVENFQVLHYRFLKELAETEKSLLFFDFPVEVTAALFGVLYTALARAEKKEGVDEITDKYSFKKAEELKGWEDEWDKIK